MVICIESVCILRSIKSDFNVSETCEFSERSIRIDSCQVQRRRNVTRTTHETRREHIYYCDFIKSRRELCAIIHIIIDISTSMHYNISYTTYISTRIMYDDLDLDYTCEDNSFNYDDEFYEDLDENYSREHTDYQELAYQHYA